MLNWVKQPLVVGMATIVSAIIAVLTFIIEYRPAQTPSKKPTAPPTICNAIGDLEVNNIQLTRSAKGVKVQWRSPQGSSCNLRYRVYKSELMGQPVLFRETSDKYIIDTDVQSCSQAHYLVTPWDGKKEGIRVSAKLALRNDRPIITYCGKYDEQVHFEWESITDKKCIDIFARYEVQQCIPDKPVYENEKCENWQDVVNDCNLQHASADKCTINNMSSEHFLIKIFAVTKYEQPGDKALLRIFNDKCMKNI